MTSPTLPTLIPEVAFATTPADPSPTWVNILADWRSGSTSRGRQKELDKYQPGTMDMLLNNRGRKYDPEYTAGPYYPNVRPMRRSRLRATWNSITYPIYDGYADKWPQDYNPPREATARLQTTDAFKILTKTDLPRSPYTIAVAADGPRSWYRLDDAVDTTSPVDSVAGRNATLLAGAPTFGADGLIPQDDGTAMTIPAPDGTPYGIRLDPSAVVTGTGDFTIEFWVSSTLVPTNASPIYQQNGATGDFAIGFDAVFIGNVGIYVSASGGIAGNRGTVNDGQPHHIAITRASAVVSVYIDGAINGATVASTDALGYLADVGAVTSVLQTEFSGVLDDLVVYDYALSAGRISAHSAAARIGWAGDTPAARLTKILDLAAWPSALRSLDTGSSTLQATSLGGTVLEHAQKVANSDFGQLFMTRDGKVRFMGRLGQLDRVSAGTFGDGAGELPYHAIGFDNGDQLIRNPVTVNRENGVAQTSSDATGLTEYLDHQYTIDGLLHDSDQLSKDAADFLVSEYKDPKTRVTTMVVAPQRSPAVLWPVVLAAELGDVFTVNRRPQGVGAVISQVCEIQGIKHDIRPGEWTVTFTLSPAYSGATASVPDGAFFRLDLTSGPGLDDLRLYF